MAIGLLQAATGLARGLTQERVGVSRRSLADIASPQVNIVHIPRTLPPPLAPRELNEVATRTGPYKRQSVCADSEVERHASQLVSELQASTRVKIRLQDDLCELAAEYAKATARVRHASNAPLHVKLEVLGHTPCPKWHADHVAARLLCTFTGPGTWYLENRYVKRKFGMSQGEPTVSVVSVDDTHAHQTGPGDLLLLKGHGWPDAWGLGAVHRSPDVDTDPLTHTDTTDREIMCDTYYGGLRLLLTIDEATPCDLGTSHEDQHTHTSHKDHHQHGGSCGC